MARSAASFGIGADDKARSVHEPDQRDVEAVAHHGEVHDLATGLRRQGAATGLRVVGDDAHDLAVETGEADGCGLAESRLDLEEASAIEDYLDDLLHVVDLGALLRNDVEDPFLIFARAFRHRRGRRQLAIVARHVAEEGADGGHRLLVGIDRSEEHTSELQSLLRSSYAVFCLKNTKKHIYKG